jgi:hypothetical protein
LAIDTSANYSEPVSGLDFAFTLYWETKNVKNSAATRTGKLESVWLVHADHRGYEGLDLRSNRPRRNSGGFA